MAGIGEATAIIAVAQIGIALSQTIIEFIGEVKDAPKAIRRIGREISTTSERLQEIGRLIDENPKRHLFSATGIDSAVRCSIECDEIITQVSGILSKGGWMPRSVALEKKDIDITLFEALRWPFLKAKLTSPQADLEKLKASLSLLFNSAMASASSNPTHSPYALRIPELKKWAERATRKAEEAKSRAYENGSKSRRSTKREVHWDEDEEDPELRQRFLDYQLKLVIEEEDRRAQERAAYLQAEQEKKRKAEEEARQAIEQKAVEDYKKEQEAIQARNTERESRLTDELKGLGLEAEQIQSIVETPSLKIAGWGEALRLEPGPQQRKSSLGISEAIQTPGDLVTSVPRSNTRRTFPWLHSRVSQSRDTDTSSLTNSLHSNFFSESNGPNLTNGAEVWLVDVISGQRIELTPSRDWIQSKLNKSRQQDISQKLARLKPLWRTAILEFLQSRNQYEALHLTWKLQVIEFPGKVSKWSLFGQRNGEHLVQLVLSQQGFGNGAMNPSLERSNNLGNNSSPSLSAELPLRYASKSQKIFDPTPSTKGSFKETSAIHDKAENHPRKPKVAFADSVDQDRSMEGFSTVVVETEIVDETPHASRGTTLIPKDLIVPRALRELGYPFRDLSEATDGSLRDMFRIPRILTRRQVEELVRLTKSKMIDGEVPWRQMPLMRYEQTNTHYYSSSQLPEMRNDDKAQVNTTASSREDTKAEVQKLENKIRDLRIQSVRDAFTKRKAPAVAVQPANDRSGASKELSLGRGSPRRRSFERYRPSDTRTEEIFIPRDERNRLVSEYDSGFSKFPYPLDEIVIRRGEPDQPVYYDRDSDSLSHPMRDRLTVGHVEVPSRREVQRTRPRENLYRTWRYDTEDTEDDFMIRPAGLNDRRRKRSRSIERYPEPPGRGSSYYDTGFEKDPPSFSRPRRRSTSPDAKPSREYDLYNAGPVVLRNHHLRSKVQHSPDRIYQGPANEYNGVRVVNFDESGESSPLEQRRRHPLKDKRPILEEDRVSTARSRPSKSDDDYPTRSGSNHAQSRRRKGGPSPDMQSRDEDIISSTLKRLTTFSGDVSLAREQPDSAWIMSSAQIDSPDASDSEGDDLQTLEAAQQKLEGLVAKQKMMTEYGDFTTAADLQYYAIPDVKFRLEELKALEAKGKKEAEMAVAALPRESNIETVIEIRRRSKPTKEADAAVATAASGVTKEAPKVEEALEDAETTGVSMIKIVSLDSAIDEVPGRNSDESEAPSILSRKDDEDARGNKPRTRGMTVISSRTSSSGSSTGSRLRSVSMNRGKSQSRSRSIDSDREKDNEDEQVEETKSRDSFQEAVINGTYAVMSNRIRRRPTVEEE